MAWVMGHLMRAFELAALQPFRAKHILGLAPEDGYLFA
jgi:hypothetical protein